MVNRNRRTKQDMKLMKAHVRYYLIHCNNNPHKAHEMMIKEHLESGKMIPYYMKGVKDFIETSKDLAIELNRTEQMRKSDREKKEAKEKIINKIMGISIDEMKEIYKKY